MPSLAFLETETKNVDFPFPSLSTTYVTNRQDSRLAQRKLPEG